MEKETFEEVAQRLQKDKYGIFISKDADVKGQLVIDTANAAFLSGMNEGAKWQEERSYSEEDMRQAFNNGAWRWRMHSKVDIFKEWLKTHKKK